MKKRFLALLLMIAMCITMIPSTPASATETVETEVVNEAAINNWAVPDLIYGEKYGTYPQNWYEKGLTGSISQAQFRVLLAGLRKKILDTDAATPSRDEKLVIDDSITVDEALHAFYTVLSNYDYTKDLGLEQYNAIEFMMGAGIYTGENGEQALEDNCSVEQALVITTRIVTVFYEALEASSKGFLWEVQSGENTVYMLGSSHLASTDIYPFSNKMLEAFQSSDALFVEADLLKQQGGAEFNQLMIYMDGSSLKDHVSLECYQNAVETAALFGLTEEMIAQMKPWSLFLVFENLATAGNSKQEQIVAQLGVDLNFLINAYFYQKPIYEIEGLYQQGLMMDSFSDGLQEYLLTMNTMALNEVINGTEDDGIVDSYERMDMMLQLWHDGDVETFKEIYSEDETDALVDEIDDTTQEYLEEYQDKMMTQRDDGMADYIDDLLKSKGSNTFFVIVGASHYISDYSVLDRLSEMGYDINQVK